MYKELEKRRSTLSCTLLLPEFSTGTTAKLPSREAQDFATEEKELWGQNRTVSCPAKIAFAASELKEPSGPR
jgi:hypothetical protein